MRVFMVLALLGAASSAKAEDSRRWDRPAYSADFYTSLRPAYRLVEGVSDGVMDFTRFYVLGAFSDESADELKGYHGMDSFSVFERSFSKRQANLLRAASGDGRSRASLGPIRETRDRMWVGREEARIAMAALQDTMRERYQLGNLTRWAGAYVRDPNDWRPASFAAAGAVGAAILYLNGVRAGYDAGPLRLMLDIEPAYKLRAASSGRSVSAASMEVRLASQPLRLKTEFGLKKGRVRSDSYSVNFEQKF